MDVKCEKCQARYRIDDGRVGPTGLTMRCGKCGNTFKVTRGGSTTGAAPGAAGAPAVSKPPPATSEGAGQTMMFGVAPVLPQKPAAVAPKPAPATTKPPPPAGKPAPDEAAGRTMMFGAPPVQPQKPAPAASKPAPQKPAPAADGAGATMMFAAAPVVAAATDASKAAKAAAAAPAARADGEEDAGSTMMFAGGPPVTPPSVPKVAPPIPVRTPDPIPAPPVVQARPEPEPEPEPEPAQEQESQHSSEPADEDSDQGAPRSGQEPEFDQGGVVAEGAESGEHTRDEPLVPQPRKIPVVPIAIGAALLVIALLALVMFKRFGKQLPTPAAVAQMAEAHQAALKDTPADYAAAETAANAALAANKRAFFPIGYAELAEIEIAWADALHDKGTPESEVKTRRQAASDALTKGNKIDSQNVDLMIAQADYFRSAGLTSSYAKAIKKASSLAANDARVVFVQGMAASSDEEGAEKALPLLKQATDSLKDSARAHYRYAVALAAARQPAEAIKELNEVLKLSPAHERAKTLLEQETAKVAPPAQAAPSPAEPKKKGK